LICLWASFLAAGSAAQAAAHANKMSSDGLKQRKNKGAGSEPIAASPPPKSKPDESSTDANKGHSKAIPETMPSTRAACSHALDWLEMHERWIPVFLLFITGFTRFYRLDKPTGVVFGAYAAACSSWRPFLQKCSDSSSERVGRGQAPLGHCIRIDHTAFRVSGRSAPVRR
jgi:hypothetical protein